LLPARSLPSPRAHWRNPRPVRRRTSGRSFKYNLRFAGQLFDGQAGLHANGFRDCYDPAIGGYCEPDPIGLAGGSVSTYTYAFNSPLTYVDPWGLAPLPIPDPNGIVPGGPWTPAGPGQPAGAFFGPKQPQGPRAQCQFVPDERSGGLPGTKQPYWKTKLPGMPGWQRYDLNGSPMTPEQAHPGNPPTSELPPSLPPAAPWAFFLWALFHSEPAY
jgi:RHS repeat-associated protein